jgi:hypothetical protein
VPKHRACGAVTCANSTGDPHLFTFDNGYYDFQAVGEFVASRSSTGDMVVQVRQAPFPGSRVVSVNSAVAVGIGTTRFGFYVDNTGLAVRRDGQPVALPVGSTALPGGATVEHRYDPHVGDAYVLHWPDGSQVSVSLSSLWGLGFSVAAAAGRRGALSGLLGDNDGDAADDAPARADIYRSFADRWRVSDATSLFDYQGGQSTATFTDRAFPDRTTTAADLPGPLRDQAVRACTVVDLTDPALLDACVLDVALTGQAMFAVSAQASDDGLFTDPAEPLPIAGPTGATEVGGPATVVAVGYPGESTRLEFSGHKGQKVTVEISASSLPDTCSPFTLRDPNDVLLGGSCVLAGKGLINEVVLPAEGTYAVVLDPPGRTIGSATVRIFGNDVQAGTIAIAGPPVTLTIAAPGASARVRFTARAGQKVFVDVLSTTLPDSCFPLSVRRPGDDAQVAFGCVLRTGGFIDGTVLPADGEYSILLNPPDNQTGTATIRLLPVTDQAGTMTVNGPPVTVTISGPGAVARFTFTGTAGQKPSLDVTGATLPDGCMLGLFNGDTRIAFGCIVGGKGEIRPTELPRTGEYTIVVDPGERGVGQAQLRLRL